MATGHVWSGWPGCYCLSCGAEHALENAMGMGWVDIGGPDEDGGALPDVWLTEDHKRLVELCDGYCPKEMSEELRTMHNLWVSDLAKRIKAWEQSEIGQKHLQAMSRPKPKEAVGQTTGEGTDMAKG